jgi:hypothetical protein
VLLKVKKRFAVARRSQAIEFHGWIPYIEWQSSLEKRTGLPSNTPELDRSDIRAEPLMY